MRNIPWIVNHGSAAERLADSHKSDECVSKIHYNNFWFSFISIVRNCSLLLQLANDTQNSGKPQLRFETWKSGPLKNAVDNYYVRHIGIKESFESLFEKTDLVAQSIMSFCFCFEEWERTNSSWIEIEKRNSRHENICWVFIQEHFELPNRRHWFPVFRSRILFSVLFDYSLHSYVQNIRSIFYMMLQEWQNRDSRTKNTSCPWIYRISLYPSLNCDSIFFVLEKRREKNFIGWMEVSHLTTINPIFSCFYMLTCSGKIVGAGVI